jgi:CRP-like cAMP-binding protein
MLTTPRTLGPLVRKLSLHTDLASEDEAALLALPHTERKLQAGQYVVREGDIPTHSCLVLSGYAIRQKILGDGGRQIVNLHMTGDMADLQNSLLSIADHNVQALGSMTAAFIPRESLVELAFSRPAIGKALWTETLIEGSIAREWIANVGRRDAQTRIAHLLCEFGFRLDAAGLGAVSNYELPMTQEQLADSVGLTPVHVNRTLKTLDASGLIVRHKRSVAISDLKRLAEVGDFRSSYLHLPQSALPEHMQSH